MSKEDIQAENEEKKQEEQADQTSESSVDENGEAEQKLHEFGEAEAVNPMEELEKNLKEEKDRYLRLYAEFENFRRRNAKERIDLIQSASAELMKELLSVIDDFERAEKSNEKADSVDSVKEGFKLVHNKFMHILKSKGLDSVDVIGQEFNAEEHEAIARIDAEEDKKGKIIDVVEKGYKLNDKIIRHPKVVVGA